MQTDRSSTESKPTAAFVLSLIAGLWMLATRGMAAGVGGRMIMRFPWFWYHRMFRGAGDMAPSLRIWSWLGAVAGILVLIGAAVIYTRPQETPTWGKVILIASAVNLIVGLGGFLPGILGIVAGVLAIGWGRARA
jgi:hypothetical protein